MSIYSYVRWKLGESRESKIFDPLKEDHPLIKDEVPCLVCTKLFKKGDQTQLLVLGGENKQDQIKIHEERWFSALAIVLHSWCCTGIYIHITCPKCKLTSYNIEDVRNSYCGNCHETIEST